MNKHFPPHTIKTSVLFSLLGVEDLDKKDESVRSCATFFRRKRGKVVNKLEASDVNIMYDDIIGMDSYSPECYQAKTVSKNKANVFSTLPRPLSFPNTSEVIACVLLDFKACGPEL